MENEENKEEVVEHITSENKVSSEHLSSETAQELDEGNELGNLKKLEAALFLSARFLSLNDLVMLTDINPLMLRELIEKLGEKYNSKESAIEIIAKEDMWKMDVKQEYVGMINKLATGSAEFTKAEQETLAVIAYKQPVKQSVIIKIRGNKAYEHVKHFIDIGLLQSKRAGHTKELRLSDEFFEYFHLQKKGDGTTELVINEEDGNGKVVVDDVEDIGEIEESSDGENEIDEKNNANIDNPNADDVDNTKKGDIDIIEKEKKEVDVGSESKDSESDDVGSESENSESDAKDVIEGG